VLNSGSPLYVPDSQRSDLLRPIRQRLEELGIQSMLLVPMPTKGRITGFLGLDVLEEPRTFDPSEVDMCQTIAAQVAVAAENVTLINDLRLQADLVASAARDVTIERGRLDAILRHLADGLLVVDTMGRIVRYNHAFVSLFCLNEQDLVGEFVAHVLPEAPLQQVIVQTSRAEKAIVHEMSLSDGRYIQVTSALVPDATREHSVVMVMRDVTPERRMEQLKSDFISTVSHKLRTPLTPVLGFAKLIKKSMLRNIAPLVPSDAKQGQQALQRVHQNLDIVIGEVERLSKLVEDALFLADLDAGRLQWERVQVNLDSLLASSAEAWQSQIDDKGLALHRDWPSDLPGVLGDGRRLARVIHILLGRAVEATASGEIRLWARDVLRQDGRWIGEVEQDLVEASDGPYVVIGVEDGGPGIPAAAQLALFDRFGQDSSSVVGDYASETGLGLAIGREIILHHDGHIWVESTLGQGSTFAILLPVISTDSDGE